MTHIETQQAKTPSHHLFLVEKKEKYLKKIFSNDLIYYIEDLLGVSFLHGADRTNEGLISKHG